ncbi:hypothetical protein SAMN05192561_101466 [Halopenitus malekzadehii]|uniref:Uncharacterized protein n=1 Tax=Halopenitus malekzadehii TaxID=1267564 RepID=A0A1H6HYA0_9EURY|nr:hypothetical protein SAMN05192561_101466 [Halopenitus malekzadehii]
MGILGVLKLPDRFEMVNIRFPPDLFRINDTILPFMIVPRKRCTPDTPPISAVFCVSFPKLMM